jgi:copper(I)-binding protein
MTRRLVVFLCAAVVVLAAVWLGTARANGAANRSVVLRVGDTVKIADTDVGCAVARRNGQTTIECLPVHRRTGAYATLAGDRRVSVVRFTSPAVAQTVFHATQHDPHATTCR